jgi:hypothetical protein
MNIKEKLNDWAKETVEVYKKQSTEIGFYTQTPLSIFLKDNIQKPDLLILGINPGSGGGIRRNTGTELLKGNPCFEGMDSDRIIKNMSEEKDNNKNRKGWALWHRVNNMLKFSNNEDHKKILRNLDRFVLSNMIFFGTEKENQIPNIKREECAKQTIELISILQPKVVLLLGSQSRKLFDRVSENKLEVLVPNSMYHCMSGKCHVLAIKHTAYYYSSIEMELIGKTIGYILDHQDETMNSETIRASSIKEEIIRFEQKQRTINLQGNESLYYLKQKISAKGCNIMIDHNGHLIYEYYCNNAHNKYIKANGTISIEISYDNKQCSFSLMTKGNHPEDLLKKVQETCDELNVFKMDSKDCFVADVGTDDGKIVEFFNDLLAIIKEYRETDLPE